MLSRDSDPFISDQENCDSSLSPTRENIFEHEELPTSDNEDSTISTHNQRISTDGAMIPPFSRFSISLPEQPALWWKTFLKFVGPGYLIAVGYLDPGNWATDLAAGSKYGYKLLFIIFLANIMAIKLQALCLRLGVVSGFDLAQACARYLPRWTSLILYVMCELAIIATDLAEVIGAAIALNLLFSIPLMTGVLITALDVLILLMFWNGKNMRGYELIIIVLVAVTAVCLFTITANSSVDWFSAMRGFLPSTAIVTEKGSIYVAVGIIGATVMPHNLYLHSSIVKYRSNRASRLGDVHEIDEEGEQFSPLPVSMKKKLPSILAMSWLDSTIALFFALLINSSILIISAANFNTGAIEVANIEDAYRLIKEILGPGFATLFAVGLLLAGQASTITGTMTAQIVMEGFLGTQYQIKPWIRKLITRSFAIVPALVCIAIYGAQGLNELLILSQIVLSLQLPFAVWPLIYFTSNREIMSVEYYDPNSSIDSKESFVNNNVEIITMCIIGLLLTIFNFVLLVEVVRGNT